MESTVLKFSLIVFVLYLSISSCVNGRATRVYVNQADNSRDSIKKQIEGIKGGPFQSTWAEWARSRAGLEADGIVQALKHHFAGASWLSVDPRRRNIRNSFAAKRITDGDRLNPTFAFVINNGGNSLDGILAATFLWLEGFQIVGFYSRRFTKEEKTKRMEHDANSLGDELVKKVLELIEPKDESALKELIVKLLAKQPMENKEEQEKITNGKTYYEPLCQLIFEGVKANYSSVDVPKLKNAVETVLSTRWKREKAGHIADGYVKSILAMLKTLGVEIYEEPAVDSPSEEDAEDFFDKYPNIIGAFDALNGVGKEHSAIFTKSYGGLAILKYLKAGMNRTNKVPIIGVDMASFEDILYTTDKELDVCIENKIITTELATQLKTDRDERVVRSDIVVTINGYRKEAMNLMENTVYYLVIPKPVQDLFDSLAHDRKPPPPSKFVPKAAWVPSDGDGKYAHRNMYRDISKLATYYKNLATVFPEVY